MGGELRFTDPAFRCEVVLSGTAAALYEAARPQFERLKGIKSLGVMAHVHEVAIHTRHQHLVGLMRIFNKLCQQPKEKGLPKAFLWSFWCRLCFAQTGHAAMSYDAEKAVLLACHLNSSFRAKLRMLIQPVIDKLSACQICTKPCLVQAKGSAEANEWFETLVDRNRWERLHLWIAALKLVQEPKLFHILARQSVHPNNQLGFSEAETFKLLVAPGCKWTTSIQNLTRLDFIVRDLAFAGTLGIQMDVDNLVASANAEHSDWNLLDNLSRYMSDTLYESLPAQTASMLFQRALATLLHKGKVTLEELFGIDLNKAIDDEDLKKRVERSTAGRQVFDPARRRSWRTWQIDTYVDKQRLPCEIEQEITGQKKGHLSHHASLRATCFKLRQQHSLAIAISHQGLAEHPQAKTFVKLCRSVLNKQYPKLSPEQLTVALFEGLVDRTCEHGLEAATDRLSKLPIDLASLRKAADVVNTLATGRLSIREELSFKIGGYEYPFHGNPQEVRINVMHAALSGNDTVRKNLGVTVEKAAEELWGELLDWQSVYFGLRLRKKLLTLVAEGQNQLALRVFSAPLGAELDLELYTLLEALKCPAENVSFRIALPNLKLLKDNGTPENEYDVVSVLLKNEKDVEVWVWGVTTTQDLATKRTADLLKIQKLKDLLGARWETDVRVVTNYIHKDGNDVCCEIDGKQERRTISSS